MKSKISKIIIQLAVGLLIQILVITCNSTHLFYKSEWNDNVAQLAQIDTGYALIPESSIRFKFINNKDSGKIVLKIADKRMQQKVLMNGLTVWIDTTGKRKQKYSFEFAPFDKLLLPQQVGDNRMNFKQLAQSTNLKGATVNRYGKMSYGDSKNAMVSLEKNNILTYQFIIPFKELGYKTNQRKSISVGVFSGNQVKQHEGHGMSEGGHGGGHGGHNGGGYGGGREDGMNPSPDGEGQQEMITSIKGWISVEIIKGK